MNKEGLELIDVWLSSPIIDKLSAREVLESMKIKLIEFEEKETEKMFESIKPKLK